MASSAWRVRSRAFSALSLCLVSRFLLLVLLRPVRPPHPMLFPPPPGFFSAWIIPTEVPMIPPPAKETPGRGDDHAFVSPYELAKR